MAVAPAELASIPLFASLSEAEREQVAGWFEPRTAAEGVTLAGEGATGYCFFVLAEGHAAVSSNGSQLATLGPGDFFGEIALVDGGRRTATVTTTVPSRAFVLGPRQFQNVLHQNVEVIHSVMRALATRVREAGAAKAD